MNQELMTLDFWQDTVIYEGKTFPVGMLACDALNVPADTISRMNEQCEKINLLLGILNAGQDTSALFPMAKEAASDNVRDSQQNAAVLLYGYTKAQGTDRKGFYCGQCAEICGVRYKSRNQFLAFRRSSRTMLMQSYSNVILLCLGIWHTPLGNTKRRCLILRKDQTKTKQTAPQRALQKCLANISHRSSLSRRAMPGCLL